MARLLLVDDDWVFRTEFGRLLQYDGHSVATAEDGLEALRLLEQEKIDVVITDIVMPRLDGFEFLTQVRQMDAPPPVIVVSDGGRGGSNLYLNLALKLGADAALTKPIVLSEMRDHIARLASGS